MRQIELLLNDTRIISIAGSSPALMDPEEHPILGAKYAHLAQLDMFKPLPPAAFLSDRALRNPHANERGAHIMSTEDIMTEKVSFLSLLSDAERREVLDTNNKVTTVAAKYHIEVKTVQAARNRAALRRGTRAILGSNQPKPHCAGSLQGLTPEKFASAINDILSGKRKMAATHASNESISRSVVSDRQIRRKPDRSISSKRMSARMAA